VQRSDMAAAFTPTQFENALHPNALLTNCLNVKRWDGRPQKERDEHATAILVMLVPAAVTARIDTGV